MRIDTQQARNRLSRCMSKLDGSFTEYIPGWANSIWYLDMMHSLSSLCDAICYTVNYMAPDSIPNEPSLNVLKTLQQAHSCVFSYIVKGASICQRIDDGVCLWDAPTTAIWLDHRSKCTAFTTMWLKFWERELEDFFKLCAPYDKAWMANNSQHIFRWLL